MYEDFYGLREQPFELTSNPRWLHLTPGHREALSNLEYGLAAAKAITVLTGEAGTGKTTVLNAALASPRCRHVRCVCVRNPTLTRGEFVHTLARSFGLSDESTESKAVLLEELERSIHDARSKGEITALAIDEAQSLSIELLEEIRLLANMETADEKLLPVVLIGQPELSERLEDRRLRQLKQRVALRCEIAPLDEGETAAYIASRIRTAGGAAHRLFTREAVILIHRYSSGIPRAISVICDNALIHGFALGRQPVQQQMVLDVCRDFSLRDAVAERGDDALAPSGAAPDEESADLYPSPEFSRWEAAAVRTSGRGHTAERRFRIFGARRP